MARLTARDYKKPKRHAPDWRRLRDVGYAFLAGAVLAGAAFAWLGAEHRKTPALADAPHPDPHHPAPAPASADAEADPGGAGSDRAAQKYDFYEMLPNFEVVVPEKDKEVKRDLPAGAPIERPGIYVLQVGSYRTDSEAERVRAQLALQGVTAKVQRVAVDADVWHRVRIGPLTDLNQLNKVRKQLRAAEVDALVIRVGD